MWYDSIFTELEKLGNKEQSQKMEAYMKNKFIFLGIARPDLKKFMKVYLNPTKKQEFDWNFVFECWNKPYREAHYIGMEYVMMHRAQVGEADLDKIKYLVTHQSWWDIVDNLDAVVGDIVLKHPTLKQTMLDWSLDEDIWLRRVAIDYQQEYKLQTDVDILAQVIKNNFGSKEFFINKAIGWSLRDYSKVNPEWVRKFVEENDEKLSALSIKEALKML